MPLPREELEARLERRARLHNASAVSRGGSLAAASEVAASAPGAPEASVTPAGPPDPPLPTLQLLAARVARGGVSEESQALEPLLSKAAPPREPWLAWRDAWWAWSQVATAALGHPGAPQPPGGAHPASD